MIPINVNLPLKTVTDRIQSCRAVHWALDAHGDRLVGELCESFDPLLSDGESTPFATQLELFARKLAANRDRMVGTDRSYRDQRARESVFRSRRDDQVKVVNSYVVGLRSAFVGIYSDEKLAELGFARRTPQQPEQLLEQATHLATRLDDPGLDLSGARFGEFQFEAPDLAKKLFRSLDALRDRIDELAREGRKTEALKLAKDDALRKYNESFLWIARTVESLFRLVGLDEVAKRIRPSSRRPGLTQREPDLPEDGESKVEGSSEPSSDAAEPTTASS